MLRDSRAFSVRATPLREMHRLGFSSLQQRLNGMMKNISHDRQAARIAGHRLSARRQAGNQVSRIPRGFTYGFRLFSITAPLHQRLQTLQDACLPNCPAAVADGGVFQQD